MIRHNVKKIERVFIKDEAYDILEKNIINGTLKPNTRLKISELSEHLGISKTPVREAILRLENEGLVVSKANQWTIVAPIKKDSVKDIYPLVYTLEAYCLREAFPHIDDALIRELQEVNDEIRDANESDHQSAILELDNQFHDLMIDRAGNEEVKPILESLKKKLQRLELLFYTSKDIHEIPSSYVEHESLIHALEHRDLDGALQALKVNWTNVFDKESLKRLTETDTYRDYFI